MVQGSRAREEPGGSPSPKIGQDLPGSTLPRVMATVRQERSQMISGSATTLEVLIDH